jgi:CRP-like cAMP-binding protein
MLSDQGKCVGILVAKGRFTPRHYRAGETIVAQGEDEARTFIVREGWGCISKTLRSGERQLIEFPVAGDVLDFSTNAAGRQEEFSTLTEMTVWEGLSSSLRPLAQSEAAVTRFITQANRRRRETLVDRLADIAKRDAGVRIAHFLLELGARLALNGISTREGYQCPLTQQDLADALGLTPIHANRMLREARTLGLYEFRRGRVDFLDYGATVEFADFDTDYLAAPDDAPPMARRHSAGAANP